MISVSYGNKKLPKSTMIFNLPARLTCPGKTEYCSKHCYALKAERIYPNVLPSRKRNLKASLDSGFVNSMTSLIQSKLGKITAVRIHESGDFYRQDYLEKWFSISERFPGLRFYAYTKSFQLDYSQKPGNFNLIASFDESTTAEAWERYEAVKGVFNNTFTIIPKLAKASCVQDCTKCSLCPFSTGLNLTVNSH